MALSLCCRRIAFLYRVVFDCAFFFPVSLSLFFSVIGYLFACFLFLLIMLSLVVSDPVCCTLSRVACFFTVLWAVFARGNSFTGDSRGVLWPPLSHTRLRQVGGTERLRIQRMSREGERVPPSFQWTLSPSGVPLSGSSPLCVSSRFAVLFSVIALC